MRLASPDPRGCFATADGTFLTLGDATSPAFLDGLNGLDQTEVTCVPEPTTFILAIAGSLLFLFGCRAREAKPEAPSARLA
jgi:hypothetical protein